jgi:hypothetical protein
MRQIGADVVIIQAVGVGLVEIARDTPPAQSAFFTSSTE